MQKNIRKIFFLLSISFCTNKILPIIKLNGYTLYPQPYVEKCPDCIEIIQTCLHNPIHTCADCINKTKKCNCCDNQKQIFSYSCPKCKKFFALEQDLFYHLFKTCASYQDHIQYNDKNYVIITPDKPISKKQVKKLNLLLKHMRK